MKNATLKLTLLIATLALLAIPAFATPIVLTQGSSAGPLVFTGVNTGYQATVTLTLNSNNSFTISVTNTGAVGSKIFSLGLTTTPTITGVTNVSSGVSGWQYCTSGNCGLGGSVEIAFGGNGNDALAPGETASVTFTFSPALAENGTLTIDSTLVHAGGLGLSEKFGDTVPEPASLVLLGTGLLSAGGFVRRKFAR
jgi:hypothetical protein